MGCSSGPVTLAFQVNSETDRKEYPRQTWDDGRRYIGSRGERYIGSRGERCFGTTVSTWTPPPSSTRKTYLECALTRHRTAPTCTLVGADNPLHHASAY